MLGVEFSKVAKKKEMRLDEDTKLAVNERPVDRLTSQLVGANVTCERRLRRIDEAELSEPLNGRWKEMTK